jgi:DnaJ-class molecular chaperone
MEKCPKCNGTGFIMNQETFNTQHCDFCHGKKELDWIDYIFGNQKGLRLWGTKTFKGKTK